MSVTSVDSTTSSTLLLASKARKGVIVENTDANRLYILMGVGTASATNFSFSLAQNENAILNGYRGDLTGIWAGDGSGAAKLTVYE